MTATIAAYCLTRAIMTDGFASTYYGKVNDGDYIYPYGVWKFAAIIGIMFGITIFLHTRYLLKHPSKENG